MNRELLYDQLEEGGLPKLTDLLSGEGKKFPYASFDPTLRSTMHSSTMPAWKTSMSGVPPAVHGVAGNEFFIREESRLGAPAPVSFSAEPLLFATNTVVARALADGPAARPRSEPRKTSADHPHQERGALERVRVPSRA